MNRNLNTKQALNLETKGIISIILNNYKELLSLKPLEPMVNSFIKTEFDKGLTRVDNQFKPQTNVIPPSNSVRLQENLHNYVFQNLQKHVDEVGDSLRQELQRSILNGDAPDEIRENLKEVFKDKKYTDRLKTVLRTETVRANNLGAIEAAKQIDSNSKIEVLKYLDVILDDRTSNICRHGEHPKYGTKEQAIPLDEPFVVKVDNVTYKAQYPPFHINCRTSIRFTKRVIKE